MVPYVTLFPLVLQGNRSLEWKYFLVTVKKNDPGVWAVYGASRHVKGWRKMTAVSHQDLTAFTKQLTPFWQMEIYPKERVFVPFLFVFLCFPLQSCSQTALIYDSTSTWGEKGNQLKLMWWILESSTLSFRREGGDLANQLELVLQKAEAHLFQRRKTGTRISDFSKISSLSVIMAFCARILWQQRSPQGKGLTRDIVSVVDGRKRACKPPSVQFNRGKKAKGAVAGKRGSIEKMGEPSQSAVSKWCTGQGWRQMLYAFLPL